MFSFEFSSLNLSQAVEMYFYNLLEKKGTLTVIILCKHRGHRQQRS